MKRIFYTIKDKFVSVQSFDLGVLVLFSIVTITFIISFIKIYF